MIIADNDNDNDDDHGMYFIDIETPMEPDPIIINDDDDLSDRRNDEGDDGKGEELETPGKEKDHSPIPTTVMDAVIAFDASMLPSTLSDLSKHFKQLIEPKPEEVSEFVCRPCVKKRYQILIHQHKFVLYVSVCSCLFKSDYI